MDAWAKHEKTTRVVKDERVIGDDWSSSRIRVDAEHLQVETGPRGGLLIKFFYVHRFLTFCTAVMIAVGEFFVRLYNDLRSNFFISMYPLTTVFF
jgi:hypothetical protein